MKMRNTCVVAAIGLCATLAQAQFLNDGDMEALTIGSTPDCATPNGAWAWPAAYVPAGNCEDGTTVSYDVALTTTKVLRQKSTSPTLNAHLPNLFTSVINETPGEIVNVDFDILAHGTAGAGAIYVGGDHGGGGFSNLTDRGPQLLFLQNGDLQYSHLDGTLVVNTTITTYPKDQWLSVRIAIDLSNDTFDLFMAPQGDPLEQVGDNLTYRSGTLTFLDRFTWAFFALTVPNVDGELDNVAVSIDEPTCYADCDGDTLLTIDDFICFQTLFALSEPSADCDGDTLLTIDDFICFQTLFAIGC